MRRKADGADAQQFARAAARGRQVDLASDCCCSRVARLHVLASPGGEARAAASLSPTPPSPLPPNLTAPALRALRLQPALLLW